MTSITTRAGKGTPLTHTEVDDNFTNLNADKLEASNNLSDVSSASAARTNLGLGTAATTAATDYATAAQGALADSALQSGDNISALTNDAGYTTNVGDITNVSAGTGLSGGGASGSVTLNVDLSELTDMTAAMIGTDEFIVLDAGADRRKAANEIGLSIFSNDAGFTTNVGDITGVTAGSGITGGGTSGTVTINHADTSSQGSVNNSGTTVIQDITLDTYGHVTALGSTTLSIPAAYTNSDVDTHLNTGTATTDQVLSWDGSDYDWVDAGSTPSTADVLSATAGADVNDVGSYCFAYYYAYNISTSSLARGSTSSGSNLKPAMIGVNGGNQDANSAYWPGNAGLYIGHGTSGSTLSGTWRLMGESQQANNAYNDKPVSLWLRIS